MKSVARRSRRLERDPERERAKWRENAVAWRSRNPGAEREKHARYYARHRERLADEALDEAIAQIPGALDRLAHSSDRFARIIGRRRFWPPTIRTMGAVEYSRDYHNITALNAIKRREASSIVSRGFAERMVAGFPLPNERGAIIYALMRHDEPAYIGQTNSLRDRVAEHVKRGEKEFDAVSWLMVQEKTDLDHIERYLVAVVAPRHNRSLLRVWWDE